jgi:uncharacterized protein YgiM (DUF1202 family)
MLMRLFFCSSLNLLQRTNIFPVLKEISGVDSFGTACSHALEEFIVYVSEASKLVVRSGASWQIFSLHGSVTSGGQLSFSYAHNLVCNLV